MTIIAWFSRRSEGFNLQCYRFCCLLVFQRGTQKHPVPRLALRLVPRLVQGTDDQGGIFPNQALEGNETSEDQILFSLAQWHPMATVRNLCNKACNLLNLDALLDLKYLPVADVFWPFCVIENVRRYKRTHVSSHGLFPCHLFWARGKAPIGQSQDPQAPLGQVSVRLLIPPGGFSRGGIGGRFSNGICSTVAVGA